MKRRSLLTDPFWLSLTENLYSVRATLSARTVVIISEHDFGTNSANSGLIHHQIIVSVADRFLSATLPVRSEGRHT